MSTDQRTHEIAVETGKAMAEFLWNYTLVTSVIVEAVANSASRGTGDAELVGTGTYFHYHGANYLVTAKHVADRARDGVIQHLPVHDGRYVAFDGPFMSAEFPLDIALARAQSEHSIQADALDTVYCPAPGELLFIFGFPASTARRMDVVTRYNKRRVVFNTFPTEGFQYITQAKAPQPHQKEDFDPRIHFALSYPANAQKEVGSTPRDLPRPDGLSGSLIWDTKRMVAERNRVAWNPGMARVCGMVHHDFDISEFLSATKVEHIRAGLLSLIRHERAYLRWLERGQPVGDALADWTWSEQKFTDLATAVAAGDQVNTAGARRAGTRSIARESPYRKNHVMSTRRFRIVFTTTSSIRLHARPSDPPVSWQFPWTLDDQQAHVLIRDRIDGSHGFPLHVGFDVQVVLTAIDLETAIAAATNLAVQHLTLMSAAGRGPTGDLRPFLAYEITPDVAQRAFRQWYEPELVPAGKTPVPVEVFGHLFEQHHTNQDPISSFRLQMAMQFYAAALRQIEPALRFMLLWPACEALDVPLRVRLRRTPADRAWGLKALAERQGEVATLIDDAYELGNDLFQVRVEADRDTLVTRIRELGDRLEPLIVPGVLVVLGLDDLVAALPTRAASAHPTQLVYSATITGDVGAWNEDTHPYLDIDYALVPLPTAAGGSLQFQQQTNITVHNMRTLSDARFEAYGPTGPNAPRHSNE